MTALQDLLKAYDRLDLFSLKKYIDENRGVLAEKDKQHIIKAFEAGENNIDFTALHGQGKLSDSKKYYSETYQK